MGYIAMLSLLTFSIRAVALNDSPKAIFGYVVARIQEVLCRKLRD